MRDDEKMWTQAATQLGVDTTERVGPVKRPVAASAAVGASLGTSIGGLRAESVGRAESIVGARSRIRGTLQFTGRAVIDGTVDGEVLVEGELVIGATGFVTGNVTAERARIAGRVKGDIHGEERIELYAGANVSGDLHCARIVIQDGAVFDGSCFMGDINALRDELENEEGMPSSAS